LLIIPLAVSACGTSVKNPTPVETVQAASANATPAQYLLFPGDELEIRFYYNPELNTAVVVRPDGKISLPLADEVQAAGLTVPALTQALRERFARELRRPDLTVIVRSFNAHRVFVGGEVGSPGVIQTVAPLTVLQSVYQAGGFRETARPEEVIVIRRTPGSTNPTVIPIDVTAVLDGSRVDQDIPLMPYDVVYVPKSPISNVNKFIDQYIRQNIPVGLGFAYGF